MSKRKSGTPRRRELRTREQGAEFSLDPRLLGIGAILIAIALAVFWRVHDYSFVEWDDQDNITDNPLYQPLATSHLGQLWTVPYYAAYIPITRLLWAMLAGTSTAADGSQIAAFDPHVYHVANLVVHCLNVLLVFLVVRFFLRNVCTSAAGDWIDWASAAGAAVFAVHPLQVEPVAWVTGMRDLLCALLSLIALYLYLLSILRKPADWVTPVLLTGASIAYGLAILSKSSAVTLPIIAALLEWSIRSANARTDDGGDRAIPRERLGLLGVWLVAAIPVVIATKHAEDLAGIRIPMVPVWQRPFVMGDTLTFYLWKTIAPVGLGPDYGRQPTWLMTHGWAYAMILVPIALCVLAWVARRRAPWSIAAVGIVFLSLLPVTGITPFDFQLFSTVADRYMYFAMLGIALAVAGIILPMPRLPATVIAVAVVASLTSLSFVQIPVWRNTKTLFTQGLRVNPRSAVSYLDLGHDKEATGNLDAAIVYYRKAVALKPDSEQAQNNLGAALGHEWNNGSHDPSTLPLLDEAQRHLELAIRLRDNLPEGHSNLANVYYSEHRYAEALAQYQAALKFDPNNLNDLYMAGIVCRLLGNEDQARPFFQKASDLGYPPAAAALKGGA